MQEGREFHSLADEEAADSLGTVKLMSAESEKISRNRTQVNRNLAYGLDGVGVEQNTLLPAEPGKIGNRIDQPGFIVRPHNTHQGCLLRIKTVGEDVPGYQSIGIRSQANNVDTPLFEPVQGVGYAWMFNLC